jgi:murein DD-endopeptidase MepM/ murein hydrolase activator NlpD
MRGVVKLVVPLALCALALESLAAHPLLRWPVRTTGGHASPGFWRVLSHVDHEPAFPDRLRDYMCRGRTYDRTDGFNHDGTDIGILPDAWNLMEAGQVEVVAAAGGVLQSKVDGNFDRSCARNIGAQANQVVIRHDDGSRTIYAHLKNGSVTPAAVGSRVAAGEYLGRVGCSGTCVLPHLHFEVVDASGRLVDPFSGPCNALNADSWWESQPPYEATQVIALTAATAPPTGPTCGADGRLQDPGSFHRKSAFARGELAYFVASVLDLPAGSPVHFELRDPAGALVYQHDTTPRAEALDSSSWFSSTRLAPNAPAGTWMLEARAGASTTQVPISVTADGAPIANYTDLWWNPSETGWGMNVNHQDDKVFATWFTYDADGAGLWLVMPDGSAQGTNVFGGTVYRTTGVPLAQIDRQPAITGSPIVVGSASLRFADADHATLSYSVNGVSQSKALQRQRFSSVTTCMQTRASRASSTNYQDLWWNDAESGWGVNIAHQGDILFATWFTYGPTGRGVWYVGPDVRRQPTGEYRGRLYRTRGIAFDRIAGAPAIVGEPVEVGELTFTFADGERGRLDYVVEGVRQGKAIARQKFGAGAPLCR